MLHLQLGEPAAELVAETAAILQRDLGPAYPWPGNVRELEQCVRRILLRRECAGDRVRVAEGAEASLRAAIDHGDASAHELLTAYCRLLHQRHRTYEEVARRTGLDRRTVKKYVTDPPS